MKRIIIKIDFLALIVAVGIVISTSSCHGGYSGRLDQAVPCALEYRVV
jgi:hypothetical protein